MITLYFLPHNFQPKEVKEDLLHTVSNKIFDGIGSQIITRIGQHIHEHFTKPATLRGTTKPIS